MIACPDCGKRYATLIAAYWCCAPARQKHAKIMAAANRYEETQARPAANGAAIPPVSAAVARAKAPVKERRTGPGALEIWEQGQG